jgi:hypothetical protein
MLWQHFTISLVDPLARVLLEQWLDDLLAGARGHGRAHDHGVEGAGGGERPADRPGAVDERRQVVAVPLVGRGQGQEHERRPVGQLDRGRGPVPLVPQGLDPGGVDVHEADVVAGGGEPLAGGAADDAGADDHNLCQRAFPPSCSMRVIRLMDKTVVVHETFEHLD